MKQVAVKGDEYEIWEDSYNDPDKKDPPPPDPLDPEDPEKYPSPPSVGSVDKVGPAQDAPDTGEEFVFCEGKPVVFVGYTFSKLKKETYTRYWKIDEETGHITSKVEDKESQVEVDVQAVDGSDFVFIDDVPVSCREGGVSAKGDSYAMIDGKLEKVGETEATGQFTECKGHVYVES